MQWQPKVRASDGATSIKEAQPFATTCWHGPGGAVNAAVPTRPLSVLTARLIWNRITFGVYLMVVRIIHVEWPPYAQTVTAEFIMARTGKL